MIVSIHRSFQVCLSAAYVGDIISLCLLRMFCNEHGKDRQGLEFIMNRPNLIEKTQQKNIKRKNNIRFYYSFLTILLLVCLVHIGVSAFQNITKSISYHGKIKKMKALNQQAYMENQRLKEELDDFSSMKSLEAIARNNLKMAGKDEVLVIINKPQPQQTQPTNKKNSKKK